MSEEVEKTLRTPAGGFEDFDSGEELSELIDTAWFYAQRFKRIQELMSMAETEYAAIQNNRARSELNGAGDKEDAEESRRAIRSFESRIIDQLEDIRERSTEHGMEEALDQAILTYAGVHLLTVNENHYLPFRDEIDQDRLSDLRAYSQGKIDDNPAPLPLKGFVTGYEVSGDSIVLNYDQENRYGVVEDLLEGESLEDILGETDIDERERVNVEAKQLSSRTGYPREFERWRLENGHLDTEPRYLQ